MAYSKQVEEDLEYMEILRDRIERGEKRMSQLIASEARLRGQKLRDNISEQRSLTFTLKELNRQKWAMEA